MSRVGSTSSFEAMVASLESRIKQGANDIGATEAVAKEFNVDDPVAIELLRGEASDFFAEKGAKEIFEMEPLTGINWDLWIRESISRSNMFALAWPNIRSVVEEDAEKYARRLDYLDGLKNKNPSNHDRAERISCEYTLATDSAKFDRYSDQFLTEIPEEAKATVALFYKEPMINSYRRTVCEYLIHSGVSMVEASGE